MRNLHNKAMECADAAKLIARRHGKNPEAMAAAVEGYEFEIAAAKLADGEPTRSILYRSAAWLAHWAELFDLSIAAAEAGLDGDPDSVLLGELETVLTVAQQSKVELANGSR